MGLLIAQLLQPKQLLRGAEAFLLGEEGDLRSLLRCGKKLQPAGKLGLLLPVCRKCYESLGIELPVSLQLCAVPPVDDGRRLSSGSRLT